MIISIFPTIRSIFSPINPFASKQIIFNDDPQRDYDQRRNSSQSSQNTQPNNQPTASNPPNPNDRNGAYGKYST